MYIVLYQNSFLEELRFYSQKGEFRLVIVTFLPHEGDANVRIHTHLPEVKLSRHFSNWRLKK